MAAPQLANDQDDVSEFAATCRSCEVPLEVPWLRCAVCRPTVDLCARCFCFGVEFGQHESDHAYTVVKLDFPLYEASWTANDEIRLLEAIQEYGLGNWCAVSGKLRTKSADECARHYFKCYVDNPQQPLPEFKDPPNNTRAAPVIFKLSDNPPRPAENSLLWSEMGGYSAARCDFAQEYDNFIEMEISGMVPESEERRDTESESDDGEIDGEIEATEGGRDEERQRKAEEKSELTVLYKDMKLAVVDVYRNCLLERQRRKKIIREYGLINLKRFNAIFKYRFKERLSLQPFMRLFPSITFDKYLESLNYERQLRKEITELIEFRRNGITKLHAVKHFYWMRQRRQQTLVNRHLLSDLLSHVKDEISCQAFLARQADGSVKLPTMSAMAASRRPAPRLNIEGLPGSERLNQQEKEFCSESRLVPQAYLDFSRILISENSKLGSLRLAQARTLIKIDVNKTRKLFDFLIHTGQVTKAS